MRRSRGSPSAARPLTKSACPSANSAWKSAADPSPGASARARVPRPARAPARRCAATPAPPRRGSGQFSPGRAARRAQPPRGAGRSRPGAGPASRSMWPRRCSIRARSTVSAAPSSASSTSATAGSRRPASQAARPPRAAVRAGARGRASGAPPVRAPSPRRRTRCGPSCGGAASASAGAASSSGPIAAAARCHARSSSRPRPASASASARCARAGRTGRRRGRSPSGRAGAGTRRGRRRSGRAVRPRRARARPPRVPSRASAREDRLELRDGVTAATRSALRVAERGGSPRRSANARSIVAPAGSGSRRGSRPASWRA